MPSFLLDSVILIDHFNNIEAATNYIIQHQDNIAISAITRAEVLTGFTVHQHLHFAKELLNQFQFLPINQPIADLAAVLRKNHHWKLPDALQASVAQYHHLRLITRNTKDFNPDLYDFVSMPYTI